MGKIQDSYGKDAGVDLFWRTKPILGILYDFYQSFFGRSGIAWIMENLFAGGGSDQWEI